MSIHLQHPDGDQPTEGEPVAHGAISRRRALTGIVAVGVVAGAAGVVGAMSAASQGGDGVEQSTPWFREAYEKLTAGRQVDARLVKIDIPDTVENGNMVPFTVTVDSAMTVDDDVRSITLLSPLNPQAFIGRFELSRASGVARVQGRLRLAASQQVVAIAELGTGQLVSGTKRVAVHIGGCGAG